MKEAIWKNVAITLFIIIVTSTGGIWFGNAITPDAKRVGQWTKWTSLGTPPEAAVKIAGESNCDRLYRVVVQSASGVHYIACPSGWRQWNSEDGFLGQMLTCQGDPPTAYNPGFKSLPHPVRDCGFKYTTEWATQEIVHTVLEDGSVWQWKFTYGIGIVIAYLIGGLITGLAVGIVISIYVWRRDRQR
jgi:hypothetical protein